MLRCFPPRALDDATLAQAFAGRPYPAFPRFPWILRPRYRVDDDRTLGHRVVTLTPRRGGSGTVLVYLHGGAYVSQLVGAHWWIVDALSRATGATIVVPDYPLAPEHRFGEAYAFLEAVVRRLRTASPTSPLVLAGDSAGGGLALGLAMALRDAGERPPERLVLFAPWVDVTLADPAARALEAVDVLLRVDRLRALGGWWAGDADPRTPRVSPLYGELGGLPPMHVFQGTHDVLLPDARTLAERVRAAGGEIELVEVVGGFHVYVGATVAPESRAAFARVGARLRPEP